MYSISQKTRIVSGQASKKMTARPNLMVHSSTKQNGFNDFVEKRKEVDKIRIERIKEIGNTFDHVVKSEIKQTVEIMSEVMPFIKNIKGVEKIIGTKDETVIEKPKDE